jgi:hypothetical protein
MRMGKICAQPYKLTALSRRETRANVAVENLTQLHEGVFYPPMGFMVLIIPPPKSLSNAQPVLSIGSKRFVPILRAISFMSTASTAVFRRRPVITKSRQRSLDTPTLSIGLSMPFRRNSTSAHAGPLKQPIKRMIVLSSQRAAMPFSWNGMKTLRPNGLPPFLFTARISEWPPLPVL